MCYLAGMHDFKRVCGLALGFAALLQGCVIVDGDEAGSQGSETTGDGDGDGDPGDGDGDSGDGDGDSGDGDGDSGDGDGDSGDGDGDGDSGDGDGDGDACELVLGQSYSSQEELECGLGPNGVVLCFWTIGFDGSMYNWSYSDVGDSGDYTCAGLDLLSVPEGEVLGTVSPSGDVLDWQGVLYDRD
jgi:hypothetical protein